MSRFDNFRSVPLRLFRYSISSKLKSEARMFPIRLLASSLVGAVLVCLASGPLASHEYALGLNKAQTQQATSPPANVIAVAFPSDAQPGDTISGTVTADPKEIADIQQIPGLHVTLYPVPTAPQPAQPSPENAPGNTLQGVVVEINGEKQPADKPLIAKLSLDAVSIALKVFTNHGSPRPIGESTVPIPKQPPIAEQPPAFTRPAETPSPVSCDIPTVTTPGGIQVIHGSSTGNANHMQITVDDKPARIIAATPRSVFWTVPSDLTGGSQTSMPSGAHKVVFSRKITKPADKLDTVTFPMYVLQMKMWADNTHLIRGQSTRMHVTITGLENLPASAWESAMPSSDLVNVNTLKERVKGLKAPKPNEPGTVVLVIENQMPDVIRLGKQNVVALQLHQQDFAHGPYTYSDVLQSLRGGSFSIQGRVSAFLKRTQGQSTNQSKPADPESPTDNRRAPKTPSAALSTNDGSSDQTFVCRKSGLKDRPRQT